MERPVEPLTGKWDHHHTALSHGGDIIKIFNRATLKLLLQDNGFEIVRFCGVGRLRWLRKSIALIIKKIS